MNTIIKFVKDHFVLSGMNEWTQLAGGYNWYSITLINIYAEYEKVTFGYEFEMMLLGLGFRVRYNTDKALALFEKWENDVAEAEKKNVNTD